MNDHDTDPPATLPDNEIPEFDLDPGVRVMSQLFDDKLTPFLQKQEARDKEFYELLEKLLNHALENHDEMKEFKREQDENRDRIAAAEKRLKKIEDHLFGDEGL